MKSVILLTFGDPKTQKVNSTHLEKKQAKNYTRARLDYFLISKNSTHLVSKIGMYRMSNLSDHRPIHLHMPFSSVQRGNGFWMFNNELLKDLKYIQGCSKTITSTLLQYSEQLRTIKMNRELIREDFADADIKFDISKTLLHDVVLMEVRSFTMKYQAGEKRKEKEKIVKIWNEIDSIQNSTNEKDVERVNILKEELQDVENQKDIMNVRRYLAKNQLEGERPTKFFCSMNKKMKAKAQFEEVHVMERAEN